MISVKLNASQLHYGLAVIATLEVLWNAAHHAFEAPFGAWVIAFWLAAIGGDKLNTANPNKP